MLPLAVVFPPTPLLVVFPPPTQLRAVSRPHAVHVLPNPAVQGFHMCLKPHPWLQRLNCPLRSHSLIPRAPCNGKVRTRVVVERWQCVWGKRSVHSANQWRYLCFREVDGLQRMCACMFFHGALPWRVRIDPRLLSQPSSTIIGVLKGQLLKGRVRTAGPPELASTATKVRLRSSLTNTWG